MRVRSTPVVTMFACLPLLAAARPLAVFRDALHGKWAATVEPDGATGKSHTDVLTFDLIGTFTSDDLSKQGYDPAPYDDRGSPIGAAATFDVTLKTKAGDAAHWQGSEAGGQLTGTVVVTPKDGTPVSYTFRAEKK